MTVSTDTTPGAAYAEASANLLGYAEDIAASLALWSMRDGNEGTLEQREAASAAMTAIDGLERRLFAVRSRLVGEMRDYDDETGRRVDAMLAEMRARDGA